MRKWIAGAAAGLGLLLGAPAAGADGPQWNGSRITTPTVVRSSTVALTAEFIRAYNPNLSGIDTVTKLTTPAGLPSGCPGSGTATIPKDAGYPKAGDRANSTVSSATASVVCNGTYSFEITATLTGTLQSPDAKTLSGTVSIAAPPPDVNGVSYSLEGGAVALSWSAIANKPPDFTGYRVERQDASGKWTAIGTLGPSATTFTDTSPPPEGGEVTYKVLGTRSSPNGEVASEGGGRVTANLPVTTTTTTPGATDAGATDGGTAGPGGTGGTTAGATDGGTAGSTDGGGRSRTSFTPRGRTGIGTRAPRVGMPLDSSMLALPDEEGFDPAIDYGELAGEEGAEDDLLVFDETSGRGLAVPIGIGAVLMGWGLHLFFLARAAKPQTMLVPVGAAGYGAAPYEDEPYQPHEPAIPGHSTSVQIIEPYDAGVDLDDADAGADDDDWVTGFGTPVPAPAPRPADTGTPSIRPAYGTGTGYTAGYRTSYGSAYGSTSGYRSYDDYDDTF